MRATAARYGHVPPDVFDEMDMDEGVDLARRVMEKRKEDVELTMKVAGEYVKILASAMIGRSLQ